MKNVRIKRYSDPAASMSIEPDDQSWILFVDKDNKPSLWIGVEAPASEEAEDGDTIHGYMPAALHEWLETAAPGTPVPGHLAGMMAAG